MCYVVCVVCVCCVLCVNVCMLRVSVVSVWLAKCLRDGTSILKG